MTVDVDAIAAAIATRYTAGAGLVPPAGLLNVRKSTADLPQKLGQMPVVLVFPVSGELEPGGQTRVGEHVFLARFYLRRATDLARETNELRRWLKVLLNVHGTASTLGGLVAIVRTRGWTLGDLSFDGITYAGVELRLQVVTSEDWSPTA